jgi:hypothetical protein
MELIKFIQNNNINNYENLKSILESETYNLKIKEDNDYPDLFLIHTQNNSPFNIPLVNECNGLILEKTSLKIVCYTFNKCLDTIDLNNIGNNININQLYMEKSLEGTLVRLFYYNNKWILSTKKCIDASKSKWVSDKNFLQLFIECSDKYDYFNNLNTNYCYSFIIMHPENKIIVNYTHPDICHISTRDLISLNEIDINIGVPKSVRTLISFSDFDCTVCNIENDNTLFCEGYIFIDESFNRIKIVKPFYSKIKNIWGNTNNRLYRYLELRKDYVLLNEYLLFFSNDRTKFIEYEDKIKNLAIGILDIYFSKHVKKNNIKIPFFLSKLIYKLHGDYFKDKIKMSYDKVMLALLDLEPKNLCFIINKYTEHVKEQFINQ